MSTKFPVVSAKDAIKAFEKIGYEIVRQKGSHIRMRNYTDPICQPITIPNHKTLKVGLLRNLLNDAGLSIEEFKKLL